MDAVAMPTDSWCRRFSLRVRTGERVDLGFPSVTGDPYASAQYDSGRFARVSQRSREYVVAKSEWSARGSHEQSPLDRPWWFAECVGVVRFSVGDPVDQQRSCLHGAHEGTPLQVKTRPFVGFRIMSR